MDIVWVGWLMCIISLGLFTVIMAWASLHSKVVAKNPRIRRIVNVTGMCILGMIGVLMAMLTKL